MTFESLLVHSIYKSSHTSSQNSFGEWTHTYTDGTSAISCRVNPIINEKRLDNTGFFDDVKYKVYMDADESLVRGDRVTYSSEEYRVKDVRTDSSSHNKTAFLSLIT